MSMLIDATDYYHGTAAGLYVPEIFILIVNLIEIQQIIYKNLDYYNEIL